VQGGGVRQKMMSLFLARLVKWSDWFKIVQPDWFASSRANKNARNKFCHKLTWLGNNFCWFPQRFTFKSRQQQMKT
jgi:hypothetical protein